jgi:hypothetical protein
MKVTTHRTEYRPTNDGGRHTLREDHDTNEFESAQEIADYLVEQGIDVPSCGSEHYFNNLWWTNAPYDHPEGYTIEQSAHQGTVPDQAWREVWVRIVKPPRDRLTFLVEQALSSVIPVDGQAPDVPQLAKTAILVLAQELHDLDELRHMIAADNNGTLWNTQVLPCADPLEHAQVLVHHDCGKTVCKVEAGDPLAVLLGLAADHHCQ